MIDSVVYYKVDLIPVKAACKFRKVEWNKTMSDRTAPNSFKRHKTSDLFFGTSPRSEQLTSVE